MGWRGNCSDGNDDDVVLVVVMMMLLLLASWGVGWAVGSVEGWIWRLKWDGNGE